MYRRKSKLIRVASAASGGKGALERERSQSRTPAVLAPPRGGGGGGAPGSLGVQGQGGTQVHRLGGVVLGPVLAPPPGLRARGPAAAGHGAQGAVWGARARPAPAFGRGQVLRLGGRPRGVAAAPPPGRGRIELLVEEHGQLLVVQPRGRRGGEVPRRAPRGLRGALRLGAHPWGALGRGGPALLPRRLGRGVRREPPPGGVRGGGGGQVGRLPPERARGVRRGGPRHGRLLGGRGRLPAAP